MTFLEIFIELMEPTVCRTRYIQKHRRTIIDSKPVGAAGPYRFPGIPRFSYSIRRTVTSLKMGRGDEERGEMTSAGSVKRCSQPDSHGVVSSFINYVARRTSSIIIVQIRTISVRRQSTILSTRLRTALRFVSTRKIRILATEPAMRLINNLGIS